MAVHKLGGRPLARPRLVSDDAILDATRQVLAEWGPVKLTLAAVGAKVGLAPPTLMQRFGSKRGLLLASAARSPLMVLRAAEEAQARNTSPLATLRDFALTSVAHMKHREELGNGFGFGFDVPTPSSGSTRWRIRPRSWTAARALPRRQGSRRAAAGCRRSGPRPPHSRLFQRRPPGLGGERLGLAHRVRRRTTGPDDRAVSLPGVTMACPWCRRDVGCGRCAAGQ
jgi:AcrR family transcriptional regulator